VRSNNELVNMHITCRHHPLAHIHIPELLKVVQYNSIAPRVDSIYSRLRQVERWKNFLKKARRMGGPAFGMKKVTVGTTHAAAIALGSHHHNVHYLVNWDNVRCLEDGEAITTTGSHLGRSHAAFHSPTKRTSSASSNHTSLSCTPAPEGHNLPTRVHTACQPAEGPPVRQWRNRYCINLVSMAGSPARCNEMS